MSDYLCLLNCPSAALCWSALFRQSMYFTLEDFVEQMMIIISNSSLSPSF